MQVALKEKIKASLAKKSTPQNLVMRANAKQGIGVALLLVKYAVAHGDADFVQVFNVLASDTAL